MVLTDPLLDSTFFIAIQFKMNVRILLWFFLFSINMVESNLTSETPHSLSLRNVLVVCYMHVYIDAQLHENCSACMFIYMYILFGFIYGVGSEQGNGGLL